MQRKAFTLIELLVVIAIIAILAAILFPVFAQAKVSAKNAVGISNVKQTGLAFYMYASDADDMTWIYQTDWHENYTPWPILAYPYTKNINILFDPAWNFDQPISPQDTWGTSTTANAWAYQIPMAMNLYGLSTDFAAGPRSMTSFQYPAERIAFAYGEDQYLTGSDNNQFSQFWFDGQKSSCPAVSQTPTEWWDDQSNQLSRAAINYHTNGIISTYVDGHAKKVPWQSVTTPQATFATEDQCQSTNFYGPDGQYGTADDPDTPLTRAWGRFWDGSY
jgi:prepilin-type N-terminal cleavage/methylation domain-containing protein